MRLTKYFVAVALVIGLTGGLIAAPPPGALFWDAGFDPKVNNAPAGGANGSIEVKGTFTENAGWEITSVALTVTDAAGGPPLGGVNGQPVSLNIVSGTINDQPVRLWGKDNGLLQPFTVVPMVVPDLPKGNYQAYVLAFYKKVNPMPGEFPTPVVSQVKLFEIK